MIPRDPFRRACWYGWGIVAFVLLVVPAACRFTQAQPDRADGPPAPEDMRCNEEWCLIKKDTLRTLIGGIRTLDAKVRELEGLCGWGKP